MFQPFPGAVANRVFFWRVNDVPIQYEARFYESYAAAIELGPEPAEEGSGEDAILDADDAVYKERCKRPSNSVRLPGYAKTEIWNLCHLLKHGRPMRRPRRCRSLGSLFGAHRCSGWYRRAVSPVVLPFCDRAVPSLAN